MSMDDPMQRLHDKATRGIALSASEQTQLDAWYSAQDQAENESLASPQPVQAISTLQMQVDTALAQLASVSSQIQTLVTQNVALRQEIEILQRRLTQTTANRPA
jgi:putative SOS response-associated peptidase YedK